MNRTTLLTYGIMVVATLVAAGMMVCHMGLIDGLDFGCGQYYYTDIPNWQKWFAGNCFTDTLPRWIYYVLFFVWGYAMYRLWTWLDAHAAGSDAGKKKEHDA